MSGQLKNRSSVSRVSQQKNSGELLSSNQGCDKLDPICVRFPLEGEWRAIQSPRDQIPSHGTNQFGQRFAYDFLHDKDYVLAAKLTTQLRWLFVGIPLVNTEGWRKRILCPVEGKVVSVQDGWPERKRLSLFDIIRAMTIDLSPSEDGSRSDFRRIGGNHVIIEADGFFVFLAHIASGSLNVTVGDQVTLGQHIGDVGHSGNSSAPHLHIHLMDSPDLLSAKGLPMSFGGYQTREGKVWMHVENGMPATGVQLRA